MPLFPPKLSLHNSLPNMHLSGDLSTLCFYHWVFVSYLALFHLPLHYALSFNFPYFTHDGRLELNGTASILNPVLSLTSDPNNNSSAGRAVYFEDMQLFDPSTGKFTDFTTHFSFQISTVTQPGQDGLAFFLAPKGSLLPADAQGGCLALFSRCHVFTVPRKDDQLVAVEFDTYPNHDWDTIDGEHVGININSIRSVNSKDSGRSLKNASRVDASIRYNSKANELSVSWTFPDDPLVGGNTSLSHVINLTTVLPEWVSIGFSAGSALYFETHEILSWEFVTSTESSPDSFSVGLIVACVIGGLISACGVVSVSVFAWRKRTRGKGKRGTVEKSESMEREMENGTGPKRFPYIELVQATNNFAEEGKLGEGGFGGVYKGFLSDSDQFVAVKKVSRRSVQGKKAYISEVKIISRLRHKNLVQLLGWCHENGDLLLVYEFMANSSLDFHLFGGRTMIPWAVRYNITLGLASALLYLHEESGQYVVHRDIKSSNIMLDSDFNAKLGDFGLARLMDEELGVRTTGVAGTWGYMAPEYVRTGKATKGTDVFSFGVVALEIACGRRPTEPEYEGPHVPLVALVWESYGKERLRDVADKELGMEFVTKEMECLMTVGLWCAHPDQSRRPSIKQAMQVLNFEAPLPNLPNNMPVPSYDVPADIPPLTPALTSTGAAPSISYSSINIGR
ncbi:L-type lectin-domain containing receptor kinase IX.1-like [Juglans microcarpa x Juglans regia]|uniref:L-type lectin-domain containing receptor kinase IX.1-like n=1 Tax=Juglans microcarpa x Juglans regia TaxID=2249226 RepID=UPI001B7E1240|nr:L-type lectin-domain containing receptor kinase IX.1-like [Juglans microcarpa x Juglans regia]